MIAIVWEFIVRADTLEAFRAAYSPDGEWARLFARSAGYAGTTLLEDAAAPGRFVTIDRWHDEESFRRMQAATHDDYARLDARCAAYTQSERWLGLFREQ